MKQKDNKIVKHKEIENTKHDWYSVIELSPADKGYDYVRCIMFLTNLKDAQYLLDALEKINVLFDTYAITKNDEEYPNLSVSWKKYKRC